MHGYLDPRGPRVGAGITTVVLAVVLVTGSGWLLAAQAVVFGIGAIAGLRWAPYGVLYRRLVQPRIGPPQTLEAEAPPRFAQAVGFAFAVSPLRTTVTATTKARLSSFMSILLLNCLRMSVDSPCRRF